MSQSTVHPERARRSWVIAAVGCVLLWRVAAFRWSSPFIPIPDELRVPIGLLGVLFLACGVWAWWARPNRWTTVFLIYSLAGGVHWGGAIGAPYVGVEQGVFFVYLAGTALFDAALLHLALIYPTGRSVARVWRAALYTPVVLALLFAGVAGFLPLMVLRTMAGLLLLVANLLSLVAGVVFLISLFTVDRALRRASRLPLVVAGMVIAGVVALLGAGGVLPGLAEAWNLALGGIPICLAIALVSHSPKRAR